MQQQSITEKTKLLSPKPNPTPLVGAVSTKLILLDRRKLKIQLHSPTYKQSSASRSPMKTTTQSFKQVKWTPKERKDFIQVNRKQIKKTFDRLWPIIKYILERYQIDEKKLLQKEQLAKQSVQNCMFPNFLKRKESSCFDQTCKLTFFRSCCNTYSEYNRILEQFFKADKDHKYTKDQVKQIRQKLKKECEQKQKYRKIQEQSDSKQSTILQHDESMHNLLGCCKQTQKKINPREELITKKQNIGAKFLQNKQCSISSTQNLKEYSSILKPLIPKLKRDLVLLKQCELFKRIQKCQNSTIYSLIAQGLEFLQQKINIMSAVTNVCAQNQLQECLKLKKRFVKIIKLNTQKISDQQITLVQQTSKNSADSVEEECKASMLDTKKLRGIYNGSARNSDGKLSQSNRPSQISVIHSQIARNNSQRSSTGMRETQRSSLGIKDKLGSIGTSQKGKQAKKLTKYLRNSESKAETQARHNRQLNNLGHQGESQSAQYSQLTKGGMIKLYSIKKLPNKDIGADSKNSSIHSSSSISRDPNETDKESDRIAEQIFQIKRRRARRARIKRIGLFDIKEFVLPIQKSDTKISRRQSDFQGKDQPKQKELKRSSLRKSMAMNAVASHRPSGGSRYSRMSSIRKPTVIEVTHQWGNSTVRQEAGSSGAAQTIKSEQNSTDRDLVKQLLSVFNSQKEQINNSQKKNTGDIKIISAKSEPIDYDEFKGEPLNINIRQNFIQNRQIVIQQCNKIKYFLKKAKSQDNFDKLIGQAENNELKVTTKLTEAEHLEYESKRINTQSMKKTYAELQQGIQKFKKDYEKCCSSKRGSRTADFFLNMFHFCILRVEDEFPEFLDYVDLKRKCNNTQVRQAAFLPTFNEIHNTVRIARRNFEKQLIDFCCTFEKIQEQQAIHQKDVSTKVVFGSCRQDTKQTK